MRKKSKNSELNIILYILLTLGLIYLIKKIYDYFIKNNWLNNSKRDLSEVSNKKPKLISNNFLNLNKDIYNNEDYKKNIVCYNETPPTVNGGIRINYYNAGKSLLL